MRRDIAGGVLVLVNAMIFIPAAIFFSTIKNESTVPASELLDQPQFQVKGSINADETAIVLRGKRPLYDGGCKVAGYSDEELDFTLLKKL